MKRKHFEKSLPNGYRQVYHIDAKSKKTGLILNAVALVIMTVTIAAACLCLRFWESDFTLHPLSLLIAWAIVMVTLVGYIFLHELVHGAAYKALTRQRLAFGLSWSCAFCGVPEVFVYRGAALFALASPLVVFTILFGGLTAWLTFVHPLYAFFAAVMLGLHWGGCAGDGYMLLLLLFKYRHKKLLMKDTGPEQFLYLPQAEKES